MINSGCAMRLPSKIPTKWAIVLVMVSMIGTATAAVALFTHTFPSVLTVAAIVTSGCGNSDLTLYPTSVPAGTGPGFVLGQCGTGPALSSIGGLVTATFSLPTAYSTLAIATHTTGTSCDGASTGYLLLASGAQFSIPSGLY